MSNVVYLNGEYLPREQAKLSVDDRGFFFGDGIYEVTRVVDGRLFEAERHMKRLARGLSEVRIDPRLTSSQILAVHERLIDANGLRSGEGTIYLQITRGAAPRTHHFPPAGTPPTVFMSASRFVPSPDVRTRGGSAITFPDIRWSRCDLKTVNLLGPVLAKQAAVDKGCNEAIFVRDSAITEGSHTNVFGVIDGEVRTYPASNYILGGVTRDVLLELCEELGLKVNLTPIFVNEIPRLEELFITGTTTDVTPISILDGSPVGSGSPGPISRALYEALASRLYAHQISGAR